MQVEVDVKCPRCGDVPADPGAVVRSVEALVKCDRCGTHTDRRLWLSNVREATGGGSVRRITEG